MLLALKINGRSVQVGESIAAAVATIERDYVGAIEVDNGQAEGPFVAFGFPRYGAVQIGVRLNKEKLTFYARERCPNGRLLQDAVPGLEVSARYEGGGKNPVASIHQGRVRYLKPAEAPVLRVEVLPEQLRAVLDACLGIKPADAAANMALVEAASLAGMPVSAEEDNPPDGRESSSRSVMPPEALLAQLDRRSATGLLGEQAALMYEYDRLRECGCPTPDHYVRHIALDDVGAGYDIESTWPGQERFIEVKTTTVAGADFFISANEREVLNAKGPKAWIYRVELQTSAEPAVTEIQDPMNSIPEHQFTPQVWRVNVP